MKPTTFYVALASTLLLGTSCQKQEIEPASQPTLCWSRPPLPDEACAITSWIQDKPAAQARLLGDWRWVRTSYPMRGVRPEDTRVETPNSIGKERIYRFTADRYIILENGQPVQDLPYSIGFQGEGTNMVDPELMLRTYSATTATAGGPASMLRLDSGLSCLELVNSYADAGGDISLKRVEGAN
jgi:hypothetical protein